MLNKTNILLIAREFCAADLAISTALKEIRRHQFKLDKAYETKGRLLTRAIEFIPEGVVVVVETAIGSVAIQRTGDVVQIEYDAASNETEALLQAEEIERPSLRNYPIWFDGSPL